MIYKGVLVGYLIFLGMDLYYNIAGADYVEVEIQSLVSDDDVNGQEGYIKLNQIALAYKSSDVESHLGVQVIFLDNHACRVLNETFITTTNQTLCQNMIDSIVDSLPEDFILLLSTIERSKLSKTCVVLLMETLLNKTKLNHGCSGLQDSSKAVSIIATTENGTLCKVKETQSYLRYNITIPDPGECSSLNDSWTAWSTCTWYNYGDKQVRYRLNGTVPVVDERDCEERTTVGELTKWGEWSTCSETCGEGFQTRIKTCFGWRQGSSRLVCYGSVTDTTKCKKGPCPDDEFVVPEETFTKADERPTAKTSGTLAIILISVLITLIILSDVTTFRIQYPFMAQNLRLKTIYGVYDLNSVLSGEQIQEMNIGTDVDQHLNEERRVEYYEFKDQMTALSNIYKQMREIKDIMIQMLNQ